MLGRMMLVVAAALSACPAEQVVDTDPDTGPSGPLMEIDRNAIEFFTQPVGKAATPIEVEIYNRGEAPLDIYSIKLAEPSAGFGLGTVGQSQRINAGSRGTFVVRFNPPGPGFFGSEVLIDSNDTVTPDRRLSVTGTGVSPELDVSPEAIVMGSVDLAERVEVVLRNRGGVTLNLQRVEVVGDLGFSVDLDEERNGRLPFEIEPLNPDSDKPTRSIFVDWTPDGSTTAEAVLRFTSDDYAHKVVDVPLSATPAGVLPR